MLILHLSRRFDTLNILRESGRDFAYIKENKIEILVSRFRTGFAYQSIVWHRWLDLRICYRGFDRRVERHGVEVRFQPWTGDNHGETGRKRESETGKKKYGKGEKERDKSLKILYIAPNGRSRAHVWRPLPLLIKRTWEKADNEERMKVKIQIHGTLDNSVVTLASERKVKFTFKRQCF